jgi:hypothetical protein
VIIVSGNQGSPGRANLDQVVALARDHDSAIGRVPMSLPQGLGPH